MSDGHQKTYLPAFCTCILHDLFPRPRPRPKPKPRPNRVCKKKKHNNNNNNKKPGWFPLPEEIYSSSCTYDKMVFHLSRAWLYPSVITKRGMHKISYIPVRAPFRGIHQGKAVSTLYSACMPETIQSIFNPHVHNCNCIVQF